MDGGEDDPETGILLTIRDDPERRKEREGAVQDDPQQHGDGPQGVQVRSSGESVFFGVHVRSSTDLFQYWPSSTRPVSLDRLILDAQTTNAPIMERLQADAAKRGGPWDDTLAAEHLSGAYLSIDRQPGVSSMLWHWLIPAGRL